MSRDRKPVLTSPWKIGVLVALLLLVTNSAVAYYMVAKYGIDFDWINSGSGMWGLDSYGFFKEMYPLAASVLICSLVSYFAIASAVRRYRFYIDSGQDYRRMISLADSIDDLTNPSQIASLSDYPEFQTILRNYGDQIREISKQIDENYEMLDNTELENELNALIEGKPVMESVEGDRWWTENVAKLAEKLKNYDAELQSLRKDVEDRRKKLGGATLSLGRITESIEEAKANLSDIVQLLSQLKEADAKAGSVASDIPGGGPEYERAVNDIGSSLDRLAEGGAAMNDFSERTNGLALNIALLAARGGIKEQDLASFAEKARNTSEKFKKLSSAVQALAAKMKADYEVVRSSSGENASGSGSADQLIQQLIPKLEECISGLRMNMDNLAKDAGSAGDLLENSRDEGGMRQQEMGAEEQPETYSSDDSKKPADDNSDELEILRSDQFAGVDDSWDDIEIDGETASTELSAEEAPATGENETEDEGEDSFEDISFSDISESMMPEQEEIEEISVEEENDSAAGGLNEAADDQMWASLNISGEESESAEDIDIEFQDNEEDEASELPESEEHPEIPSADIIEEEDGSYAIDPEEVAGLESAYDEFLERSVDQQEQSVKSAAEKIEDAQEEEDPVIDLLELGAEEIGKADIIQ